MGQSAATFSIACFLEIILRKHIFRCCERINQLGFAGELSRTQVSDKLRRAACSFVREKTPNDVRDGLIAELRALNARIHALPYRK